MPRALRTLGRLVKYSVGIGGGLFLGDILINDEFDSSVTNRFRQRISAEQRAMEPRPRVLILGAGWGGLSMVRKLHTDKFDVTLVNPKNYFLFTPLLASTTTGRTSKSSIIEPVRHFCKRADAEDVRFIESEAVSVNLESQTVTCRDISDMHTSNDSFDVPYDYLVIGVGAEPATFGTPGVKEHAVFLKQIEHSRVIRSRILDALETACIPGQSDAEIERLLSFVVVGGGPTGVEYAGELADFLKRDAKRAYPPDIASRCSIRIVEGLPHVLARFEPQTIEYAEKQLKKENVILECDQFVKRVEAGKLTLSHRVTKESSTVPFGVLVWVTGIAAQPLVKDLIAAIGKGKGQTKTNALIVDERLRVCGLDNVFALGDCAMEPQRLPQTAQVASQEGKWLGRAFNECAEKLHQTMLAKREAAAVTSDVTVSTSTVDTATIFDKVKPFAYHHKGSMAYVGSGKAVADLPSLQQDANDAGGKHSFHGDLTYWAWRSVYMSKLLSFTKRMAVGTDWVRTSAFGRDTSRHE